ncbi:MAG: cellulose biosynthesis cyclic di-GMP-binding regulatory protein BcsB [Pseudomonadota bacterium]
MRMIGIGLMGFLLAGIALLLSTMNILEKGRRYILEATSGPQLVFEHRTAPVSDSTNHAVLARANSDQPIILSGFPAYQSAVFIMPVDARPTSGYLQINATSQVLDGVEGVLRISIRNVRRGEVLLRSGEVGRSLQIPLSPTDFAGSQLVVSFSLQGTGPQQQCTQEGSTPAVVEIETTSAVFLTLDRPLESARDQVHAWGNLVRVGWPTWLKREEQVRRLVLATQFQQRGVQTVFDGASNGDGLTTDGLRSALTELPVAVGPLTSPPLTLLRAGSGTGVRQFYRQAVWRERYALDGHAPQRIPTHLDLHMTFGRLIGGHSWTFTVTLNKRLVFQDHIAGTQSDYSALIALPINVQSSSNEIEIVATSSAPRGGLCDRGPELVAEMLSKTQLVLGDVPYSDPVTDLRAMLSGIGPIKVASATSLTPLDAALVSDWLSVVVPQNAKLKPADTHAHIVVVTPDSPELNLAGTGWLAFHAADGLKVHRLDAGSEVPGNRLALLIAPDTIKIPVESS